MARERQNGSTRRSSGQANGRASQSERRGREVQGAAAYFDKQPPFDLQAELSVLGSAVLNPEVLDDITGLLQPEDFYDSAHEMIFRTLVAVHQSNRRFDIVLLTDRLKSEDLYEVVGGAKYLMEILNAVPNAAHAVYYAEIVRKHAIARRLIIGCTEILADAYDRASPVEELVARTESVAARISDSTITPQDTRSFSEAMFASMDALQARMDGTHQRLLDVGLDAFDNVMGLGPGGLTVVAGRPGMGKTAAAVRIARYLAREHKRVYFVTLEMTATELIERMLAAEARENYSLMAKGRINATQRQNITDHSMCMSSWPIFLDDSPSRNVPQIGATARRLTRRYGTLDAIIIDYLQLISPDNARDPRQEQVAKISRGLKLLAREMKVPVICMAQVNRETEEAADKRPRLSHLRESGAIEQDADSVVFVHRPKYYTKEETPYMQPEEAELNVEKNRNGPTRRFEAMYFREWMSWENKAGPQFADQSQPAEERTTHF
jgi:replicative DNA helicase